MGGPGPGPPDHPDPPKKTQKQLGKAGGMGRGDWEGRWGCVTMGGGARPKQGPMGFFGPFSVLLHPFETSMSGTDAELHPGSDFPGPEAQNAKINQIILTKYPTLRYRSDSSGCKAKKENHIGVQIQCRTGGFRILQQVTTIGKLIYKTYRTY